jgi:flagellar motility protein MotE (MotC chaperone)
MNFLKSRWFPAILAALLCCGTTAILIFLQREALFANLPKVNIEAPPLLWSFKDAEIEKFVSELRAERKKLEARELDLEKANVQLATERAELEKVRSDVQTLRDQFSAAIVEMQDAEAKNLKTLAATYSSMAPAAAVSVLAEMDETMVVKILFLMKTDKVAAVFQEMARPRNPDLGLAKRAAHLSDKLRLLKVSKDPQKP